MSRIGELRVRAESSWASALPAVLAFAREVSAAVNGGFALFDQLRNVRKVVIDTAELPVFVETTPAARPLGVALVRAVERDGSGLVLSGGVVTWDAVAGGVRIHSFGALSASTRYDAVIAVVE